MGETILIVALAVGMIVITGVVWWIENGPKKSETQNETVNDKKRR